MDDRELLIMLYDYYGELFSKEQKEFFEWYYFDNLSLGEISEITNKSRNAIHSMIKRVSDKLLYYENVLKLYKKSKMFMKIINDIEDRDIKNKLEELYEE